MFINLRIWLRANSGYSLIELVLVILIAGSVSPGLIGLFTTLTNNSHQAEFTSIAMYLAAEQIEIILADKAGSGTGYGYAAITSAKYASVQPSSPFNGFNRTVSVQTVNSGQAMEYKRITVTVSHALIPTITLVTMVTNHSTIS